MGNSLRVLAVSTLLMSCARHESANTIPAEGHYAHASMVDCTIKNCLAHVEIESTCTSGPLNTSIWRDTPVRGQPLFEGKLGDQRLVAGNATTIRVPVCGSALEPVQA